jgi:hypothetical protein
MGLNLGAKARLPCAENQFNFSKIYGGIAGTDRGPCESADPTRRASIVPTAEPPVIGRRHALTLKLDGEAGGGRETFRGSQGRAPARPSWSRLPLCNQTLCQVANTEGGGTDQLQVARRAAILRVHPDEQDFRSKGLSSRVESGPQNRSLTGTRSAVAMVWIASSDGLAHPVSTRDMYERAKPHFSANSSCLSPAASRSWRTRSPNRTRRGFINPACCATVH